MANEPITVRAGSNPHGHKPAPNVLPPYSYFDDLVAMSCDLVDIPKLDPRTPKNYVARALIMSGGIGYLDNNTVARGFYHARPLGEPIRFDEWERFQFSDRLGRTNFEVSRAAGARYIRANATATPPRMILERLSVLLDLCDRSIAANIRAQILGRVVGTTNKKNETDLWATFDSFERGLPVGLDAEALANLQPVDLTVPITFDRLLAARAAIWSDAMQRVGSVAAMQYSHERTQSAEVNAYIASTIDFVYIMINTFNDDCRRQHILGTDGKPLKMIYTGYAARFDDDPNVVQRTGTEANESEDTDDATI